MSYVVRQKNTLRAHHIHEALNLQLLCLSVVDIVLGQQRSSVTGRKQFQATGDLMRVGLLRHMGNRSMVPSWIFPPSFTRKGALG